MRSVLITGGAGFIGSNFCHYWKKKYSEDCLIVLDLLTHGSNRNNLAALEENEELRFVHGDICDQPLVEELLREHHIDLIVHFAAESHVDRSISGPDVFIQTNVIGTHSLLKAARQVWQIEGQSPDDHLLHHVSTDEVYGSLSTDDPPFSENTPYAPNSPYSASKAASDHLVRAYHHTFGLNVTTSNCSNNYGPFQDQEKLIPTIINSVLNGNKIPVYGDGKNIRDWLFVDDHCRAIDLIMVNGRRGETYNVGGENEWQNIDIVNLICDHIDKLLRDREPLRSLYPDSPAVQGRSSRELIEYVTDRLGHDRRYAIDPEKCHQELDYRPKVNFERGLKITLDWYIQSES